MCMVSLAWLGVVFRYHGWDMMGHFVSVDKAHVSFWVTGRDSCWRHWDTVGKGIGEDQG